MEKGITFNDLTLFDENNERISIRRKFKSADKMPILEDLYNLLINTDKTYKLGVLLKPYVYGIVNSMLTGEEFGGVKYDPAPVGAVLMNHAIATTNDTAKLIQAIIELNGKYFLNFDASKPAWPDLTGSGNGEGEQTPDGGDDEDQGDN